MRTGRDENRIEATEFRGPDMGGLTSYQAGRAAEDRVAAAYVDHGHRMLTRRWRGPGGEIDLIFEKDGEVIFVEVKSSRSHDRAAASLSRCQIARIIASAEASLDYFPKGSLTPVRFDVALVDQRGRVAVIANALAAA